MYLYILLSDLFALFGKDLSRLFSGADLKSPFCHAGSQVTGRGCLFADEIGADLQFLCTGRSITFVIGRDGVVVYSGVGYDEAVAAEVKEAIDKALL